MSYQPSETEKQLLDAVKNIAQLNDCNAMYTYFLSRKIDELELSVMQLTLSELIKLNNEAGEEFNKHCERAEQSARMTV